MSVIVLMPTARNKMKDTKKLCLFYWFVFVLLNLTHTIKSR